MTWPTDVPQPYQRHPHAEPQPYHRLLRTRRARPWMPLVGLPLVALAVLVAGLAIGVALVAVAVLAGAEIDRDTLLPFDSPAYYLLTNLTIAAGLPATMLVVLVVHRERVGWLSSVQGRLRWRLLLPFGLLALLAEAVGTLGYLLVPAPPGDAGLPAATGFPGAAAFAAFAAVVLLTTPLQAAAEEFVFRGYLAQAIGYLSRSWLPPALIGSALFALAHGAQDPGAFADRFVFGVVFSWLAWRTGGLEASIALHTMHNVVALLLSAGSGSLPDPSVTTRLPLRYLAVDLATFSVYALAVAWLARRRGLVRLSAVDVSAFHDTA